MAASHNPAHSPVLAMEGVCLSFGAKRVLDGPTFDVQRGECFGFLGPREQARPPRSSCSRASSRQMSVESPCLVARSSTQATPITTASASCQTRVASTSVLSIEENLRLYAQIRGRGEHGIDHLLERMGSKPTDARSSKTARRACASARHSPRHSSTAPSCYSSMNRRAGLIQRRGRRRKRKNTSRNKPQIAASISVSARSRCAAGQSRRRRPRRSRQVLPMPAGGFAAARNAAPVQREAAG